MQIILVDAEPADQGDDTAWESLTQLGTVKRYARINPADLAQVAKDADVIITNKIPLSADQFQSLPQLKYVGVSATGYDIIDLNAARQHKVAVTNVPGYSTASVAQATIALILECCNHVGAHAQRVAEGDWETNPDFCFLDSPIKELTNSTLLLVGSGAIGQQAGQIAAALGMKILNAQVPGRPARADRIPLAEALPQADIISLHCPLTPNTTGLIGTHTLGMCKSDVIIVNTARGPLIDEAALAQWLDANPLAQCAVDVLSEEPPKNGSLLIGHPQAIITPHIAWAGNQARSTLRDEIAANLKAWQQGERRNRLDS